MNRRDAIKKFTAVLTALPLVGRLFANVGACDFTDGIAIESIECESADTWPEVDSGDCLVIDFNESGPFKPGDFVKVVGIGPGTRMVACNHDDNEAVAMVEMVACDNPNRAMLRFL